MIYVKEVGIMEHLYGTKFCSGQPREGVKLKWSQ